MENYKFQNNCRKNTSFTYIHCIMVLGDFLLEWYQLAHLKPLQRHPHLGDLKYNYVI